MPKAFDDCVKNGGKVRRKNLKGNKYINICYDKNGKSHAGEVMTKKSKKKAKSNRYDRQIEKSKKLAESLKDLQRYFHDNYHS